MQRKRIIWIDDEVEYFRAHIMFLEARGYSVQPVYDGSDGLAMILKHPHAYDIVLLDEQMPGIDGLAILYKIKEALPDMPVVMVTKSEEEDLMERVIEISIDGYLTKPVNPSQILMTCKRLLHSQEIISDNVKNAFVKSYSEIEELMRDTENMTHKDWVSVYQKIVRRELDIEDIDEENMRQKHFQQRFDANMKFSNFIVHNYPNWVINANRDIEKPSLSTDILSKYIIPAANDSEKFALVILDSIQLDQFVIIQRFLKRIFQNVGTYFYYSVLPTTHAHALTSFFTGLFPAQFAKEKPTLWEGMSSGANVFKEIADYGFKRQQCKRTPMFHNMSRNTVNPNNVFARLNPEANIPIIYADFLDMLHANRQSKLIKEIISSSKAFREMTSLWFEKSPLYDTLERMCDEDYTIAFTVSSGNILCTTPSEYYGAATGYSNARFRSGENIDVDRRVGHHILHPSDYGLPIKNEKTEVNILNCNYFFTTHTAYKDPGKSHASVFERGGISLEETIVPLAIMKPAEQRILRFYD